MKAVILGLAAIVALPAVASADYRDRDRGSRFSVNAGYSNYNSSFRVGYSEGYRRGGGDYVSVRFGWSSPAPYCYPRPVYCPPPVVYRPPVYYTPAPVIYAPPPVVYTPAPVVYTPPVYCPPPVVYTPPPVVYTPPVVYAPAPYYAPYPASGVSVGFSYRSR